MADMVALMNTILDNASTEYQTRVPTATRTNIADVGDPIITYQSTQNEFLTALIDRIAMTIVRNRIIQNPLAILKQGGIPLGKDIQEIFTNPATGEQYDPTGANLLTRKIPDTYALYHRMNRQAQYPITVTRAQLKLAFTEWAKLEELLNSIVNALYSGDNYDEFILMKNLIADAVNTNKIVVAKVGKITDADSARAFVKDVKTASSLFQFPGSNFNRFKAIQAAQQPPVVVKDIITWCPREDQILLIRSDIATAIDVEVLAVAFNLTKAEFMGRMIEVDSFGAAANCVAVLADKSLFQIYDNLQEMSEFYNPKGLYWNYYWNHWQTYSISHFANAIAFIDETLSITPASVTLSLGGTTTQQLTATVDPDTLDVTYSSSNEAKATVSETGLITAVAIGTATITAETPNGTKDICEVTVTA